MFVAAFMVIFDLLTQKKNSALFFFHSSVNKVPLKVKIVISINQNHWKLVEALVGASTSFWSDISGIY